MVPTFAVEFPLGGVASLVHKILSQACLTFWRVSSFVLRVPSFLLKYYPLVLVELDEIVLSDCTVKRDRPIIKLYTALALASIIYLLQTNHITTTASFGNDIPITTLAVGMWGERKRSPAMCFK